MLNRNLLLVSVDQILEISELVRPHLPDEVKKDLDELVRNTARTNFKAPGFQRPELPPDATPEQRQEHLADKLNEAFSSNNGVSPIQALAAITVNDLSHVLARCIEEGAIQKDQLTPSTLRDILEKVEIDLAWLPDAFDRETVESSILPELGLSCDINTPDPDWTDDDEGPLTEMYENMSRIEGMDFWMDTQPDDWG